MSIKCTLSSLEYVFYSKKKPRSQRPLFPWNYLIPGNSIFIYLVIFIVRDIQCSLSSSQFIIISLFFLISSFSNLIIISLGYHIHTHTYTLSSFIFQIAGIFYLIRQALYSFILFICLSMDPQVVSISWPLRIML